MASETPADQVLRSEVPNDGTLDEENLEVERYELREPPAYRFEVTRREFVQVLGAGVVISVAIATTGSAQPPGRRRGGGRRSERMSERFHLGADGAVTVLTGKVEVGQGSRTQIAMAAAEELRLPLESVRVVMADTELCPDDGGTSGSRTTPSTVPQVRSAAAALRDVLTKLAAEQLATEPEKLRVAEGAFVDPAAGKQVTLAELAKAESFAARLDVAAPAGVEITPVQQWQVLGRAADKAEGVQVVTGAHKYPSDIQLPGLLYGKVLRPASIGAELTAIDLTPAQQMPGVTVVRDGNFIGCAAASSWAAAAALEAVAATAQWRRLEHPSSDQLYEHLKRTARSGGSGRFRGRSNTWGRMSEALEGARHKLESNYTVAYVQHAPMEPRAAVAQWQDGKLTVWTGTQQPSRVRGELSSAFRLPADRVRVIVPDTGGGFGGKHTGEAALEAARLAKAAGRPVSVRWTRREEFAEAYCRPAGLIDVTAALDAEGRISAWDFANYNSGGSALETPYRTASGRTRFLSCDSPLRQGSYRALASTANTFARESMMDELALAAAADPLEFRRRHLPSSGRLRDVLEAAARQFGWSQRRAKAEPGRGVGLACGTEKGSYVAACAEVEVRDGRFRVLSVCQAYECGAIQNPGNLRSQVEGCIVMGLGAALSEEMQFQDGVVTSDSFSQYIVPRASDLPALDIVLRDRVDLPSVGAGETPIIAVAPAVANAICHASGQRLRSMPLKSDTLRAG